MRLRTGVDIIEIERIEKSMQNPRFLRRLFGDEERRQLAARGGNPASVAGNFCAKEAFAKAMGCGMRDFAWKDVQLLRRPDGKPYLALCGAAAAMAGDLALDVSISHNRTAAVAFVVACAAAEKEDA